MPVAPDALLLSFAVLRCGGLIPYHALLIVWCAVAVLLISPELLPVQRGRVARQLRTLQVRPVKVLPHECRQL